MFNKIKSLLKDIQLKPESKLLKFEELNKLFASEITYRLTNSSQLLVNSFNNIEGLITEFKDALKQLKNKKLDDSEEETEKIELLKAYANFLVRIEAPEIINFTELKRSYVLYQEAQKKLDIIISPEMESKLSKELDLLGSLTSKITKQFSSCFKKMDGLNFEKIILLEDVMVTSKQKRSEKEKLQYELLMLTKKQLRAKDLQKTIKDSMPAEFIELNDEETKINAKKINLLSIAITEFFEKISPILQEKLDQELVNEFVVKPYVETPVIALHHDKNLKILDELNDLRINNPAIGIAMMDFDVSLLKVYQKLNETIGGNVNFKRDPKAALIEDKQYKLVHLKSQLKKLELELSETKISLKELNYFDYLRNIELLFYDSMKLNISIIGESPIEDEQKEKGEDSDFE